MAETKDMNVHMRVNGELWKEYRERLNEAGSNASAELTQFILWQLGRRGARKPQRLDES
jgi:hypothetical protein